MRIRVSGLSGLSGLMALLAIVFSGSSAAVEGMKCPERTFTETEIQDALMKARTRFTDVPPPYAQQELRFDRIRCLYVLFEYQLAEGRRSGNWQSYTFDPYGELMDYYQNDRLK